MNAGLVISLLVIAYATGLAVGMGPGTRRELARLRKENTRLRRWLDHERNHA